MAQTGKPKGVNGTDALDDGRLALGVRQELFGGIMGYSKWDAMGRLTKDPEVKTMDSGSMTIFALAVDRPFSHETDFFNCIAWGKTGERIAQNCFKGTKIVVHGFPRKTSWTDKNGSKREDTNFTVTEFHFCESKKDNSYIATDDDLPF